MRTIAFNTYPQHKLDTFILVLPSKQMYEIGNEYVIQDFFTKEYLGKKIIVEKQTFVFEYLPEHYCYLAKNCDKKTFYKIIHNQFKSRLTQDKINRFPRKDQSLYKVGQLYSYITKKTKFDVLTLTCRSCIKDLNKNHPIIYEQVSKLSKKPLLKKTYCHVSKFNFEQQRPYTQDELEIIKESSC